jgi:hypothetical protein
VRYFCKFKFIHISFAKGFFHSLSISWSLRGGRCHFFVLCVGREKNDDKANRHNFLAEDI